MHREPLCTGLLVGLLVGACVGSEAAPAAQGDQDLTQGGEQPENKMDVARMRERMDRQEKERQERERREAFMNRARNRSSAGP